MENIILWIGIIAYLFWLSSGFSEAKEQEEKEREVLRKLAKRYLGEDL